MFTKHQILSYLKYSIAAATAYLICVYIFLSMDSYLQTYILYIGNMVFASVMVIFIVNFSKKRDNNVSPKMTIAAGLITAAMGVIISCLVIFIMLAIMKPSGYNDIIHTSNILAKPAPSLQGNGHALMFILFMDAVFGNIGAGAFVSFMLPTMLRNDLTGDPSTMHPK